LAVTIKDIAKVAGVSHTTVSRALRENPAISTETTARITRIADDLGYVPNTAARGLKTNRSGVLGVIVRRIVDPFFSEVLHGIEDVIQAEGYSLFLAASNRDPQREKAIIRTMSEHRVDGVIICFTEVGEEHQQQLRQLGVASVLINNQAPHNPALNAVGHDDVYGSRMITRHLIELGHRRIAYVGNANSGRTTIDRQQGFLQEMAAADLLVSPEYMIDSPNGLPDGGVTVGEHLLYLPQPPTAVVCYNDMVAMGMIQAWQQAGYKIPDDCSITGFDNIEISAYVHPPLTTLNQPRYELGYEAAQMVLRRLFVDADDTTPEQNEAMVLRGELCIRGSTRHHQS